MGTFTTTPLIFSWFSANIGGKTKRLWAAGLILGFGNIGGAISGQIYRSNYRIGHLTNVAFMSLTLICILILHLLMKRENRIRIRLTSEQQQPEIQPMRGQLGDRDPGFKYIL
ncbi:unnamed protein product [Didymodactylos carnosus]|uniref:Uncharacterized protein n=1 Tax=Didymodactylos carnosus TaxID=1234261 RepID=A0A815XZH2_9BILA|nr:unnamed protein product [Didymodactylos carnosus]CAF1563789.1 unnamed protein product [Didymodactylos carnosus]CAF4339346.1 unnamed protein product [Didymodactylos carnosus]CAF4425605.1 unnamed protein product [Didymodactylos carnosus]